MGHCAWVRLRTLTWSSSLAREQMGVMEAMLPSRSTTCTQQCHITKPHELNSKLWL